MMNRVVRCMVVVLSLGGIWGQVSGAWLVGPAVSAAKYLVSARAPVDTSAAHLDALLRDRKFEELTAILRATLASCTVGAEFSDWIRGVTEAELSVPVMYIYFRNQVHGFEHTGAVATAEELQALLVLMVKIMAYAVVDAAIYLRACNEAVARRQIASTVVTTAHEQMRHAYKGLRSRLSEKRDAILAAKTDATGIAVTVITERIQVDWRRERENLATWAVLHFAPWIVKTYRSQTLAASVSSSVGYWTGRRVGFGQQSPGGILFGNPEPLESLVFGGMPGETLVTWYGELLPKVAAKFVTLASDWERLFGLEFDSILEEAWVKGAERGGGAAPIDVAAARRRVGVVDGKAAEADGASSDEDAGAGGAAGSGGAIVAALNTAVAAVSITAGEEDGDTGVADGAGAGAGEKKKKKKKKANGGVAGAAGAGGAHK